MVFDMHSLFTWITTFTSI